MAYEGLSGKDKRAMYCAFAALITLATFGAAAEYLSHLDLPDSSFKDRVVSYLVFSLFTFLLATTAAVTAILSMSAMIQAGLILLAFLTNTVAVALSLSPKTSLVSTYDDLFSTIGAYMLILSLLSWAAELFLLAALFHVRPELGGGGGAHNDTKATTASPTYNPTPVSMGAPYTPPVTSSVPPPPPPPGGKTV